MIVYDDQNSVQKAIQQMNGRTLLNNTIKVSTQVEVPPPPRMDHNRDDSEPRGRGGYRGGFRGRAMAPPRGGLGGRGGRGGRSFVAVIERDDYDGDLRT